MKHMLDKPSRITGARLLRYTGISRGMHGAGPNRSVLALLRRRRAAGATRVTAYAAIDRGRTV